MIESDHSVNSSPELTRRNKDNNHKESEYMDLENSARILENFRTIVFLSNFGNRVLGVSLVQVKRICNFLAIFHVAVSFLCFYLIDTRYSAQLAVFRIES